MSDLEQQIRDGATRLSTLPDFREDLWLTLYLAGQPEDLAELAGQLSADGWINVDGSDSGFIYPKKLARNHGEDIVELALRTSELCGHHAVELLTIDADTSPEVDRSKFVTLFQA